MKNKVRIGEVARHHNISKQALIHYDRIGLLKPSIVRENQYRYYSFEDLDRLDLILSLKDAGFSLKEIKSYIDNPSLEDSLDLLKKQSATLEERIQKLQQTQLKITHKINTIERLKNLEFNDDIRLTTFEERYMLLEPISGPIDDINVFGDALKKINQEVLEDEDYIQYAHDVEGVTVNTEAFARGTFDQITNIFIFLDQYREKKNEAKLPKGLYLSYYHHGLYADTYKSYKKILAYIQKHKLGIIGQALEIPLITAWSVKTEEEYIIEIQIPVTYL
jgi:DNA-binding transcriptional MerR regulator